MTMHTEGPWSVAETRHNYDTVIRGPKGEPIALALIAGYTKQEGAANTALLAAAPDLLEALQELCEIVEDAIEQKSAKDLDSFTLQPARAAIARATGESE
jgi:hypothetical protein